MHLVVRKENIRTTTAMYIDKLIDINGESIVYDKQFKDILRSIGTFVIGNSENMRYYAKQAIAKVCEYIGLFEFQSIAEDYLPKGQYMAIKKYIERGIHNDNDNPAMTDPIGLNNKSYSRNRTLSFSSSRKSLTTRPRTSSSTYVNLAALAYQIDQCLVKIHYQGVNQEED